jgi:hypothetical protein
MGKPMLNIADMCPGLLVSAHSNPRFQISLFVVYRYTKEVVVRLKEWNCIKVRNCKDVGKTIEEWQKQGWDLHTYSCTQYGIGGDANHYLLFEREKSK